MERINVLMVDDEALIREGLRSLLEKESFIGEIFEATDADEFTECLANNKVHIVLLDIRLRNTTGVELLELMKKMEWRPKVVAVTGMEGVELMINLLKNGVDGIVYKLDGYEEIRKTIRSILEVNTFDPMKAEKVLKTIGGALLLQFDTVQRKRTVRA